ncbi:MAG: hypothetical protein AAF525_13080, partial [Pseudomonadota bacterium]
VVLMTMAALPLVWPAPLFAYSVTVGNLTVASDQPIPDAAGRAFLEDVAARLDESPLTAERPHMHIYIANTQWRRHWLWIPVMGQPVGGFVTLPLSRNHTFLSGADFSTGELIAPSGFRPPKPRDLVYYGAHELTHVMTGEQMGDIASHFAPEWVREGLADYVALPRQSAQSLFDAIGTRDADLPMMHAHGVYAPYRLVVIWLLEDEDWSIDELLATDLEFEAVQMQMARALDQGHG